jgi:hypothetical protein
MTVTCPDCGESFEDGTQFCDLCGTELPQPEPTIVEVDEAEVEAGKKEDEAVAQPKSFPAPAGARLIVTRGAELGKEYPLAAGENEIGRWDEEEGYMPHIDLGPQDTEGYVHRRHAMIRLDAGQWWLEHLQQPPSNPTMIRGRGDRLEVGSPIALKHGDEIVVGRVILKFVLDE